MTKRIATVFFLLIFSLSTVGRIMDRTEAWAAEHAYHSKDFSRHFASYETNQSTAEAHKQITREKQTKLFEDGSVLHVSFARSSNTPPSSDAFARSLADFVQDPNSRPRSSRAPPSLLF